ncbi:hypothetical protein CVT26_010957 [Gymnopilus dilepis]|uniref:Rab proteins geranylgeranyltransferase n=1 Tax=Gymnopilus dilepis TaxID=231916 RepID=A0A409VJ59_9AGAR|nr:hypothetical protein CVT26_010957 [Gymnopilus dilepis]
MKENHFDVAILGTGLVESITAAALSKAGYKVAHIDPNPYYGAEEASLSLEELVKWADETTSSSPTSRFCHISRSSDVPSQSRQYAICLQPSVIPSVGPLISSLIMSGVAKYSGFRLLDSVSVYDASGRTRSVPGSKEDIFKSKDISLIEKRRLMRFLTFAAGDFAEQKEFEGKADIPFLQFLQSTFSLSQETSTVIAYSLAFCMSPTEPTGSTLQRLQRYLRSSGRYGPSPFLVGHYGGIGDIAQGFCRASAVSGGVYILGRKITKLSRVQPITSPLDASPPPAEIDDEPTFNYDLVLEDFPDTLQCNLVISSAAFVPPDFNDQTSTLSRLTEGSRPDVSCMARCIAIIDEPLSLKSSPSGPVQEEATEQADNSSSAESRGAVDTGVLVFPPSTVSGGSTTHSCTVFINGEGSLATPKGKWLIYIGLPLQIQPDTSTTPETLIGPYLNTLMRLSADPSKAPLKPLFTTFYLERPSSASGSAPSSDHSPVGDYIVPPPLPIASLPDISDEAAQIAERTFVEAVKALRKSGQDVGDTDILFWPPLPAEEDNDDDEW